MKTAIRSVGLLLVLFAGTTTGLQAQKLASGTWAGKGVDPGGEEFPITFDVQTTADSLAITMVGPDGERVELSNIRFEEEKLLFRWAPGIVIDCVRPVEGGGYSGPCTDDSGGTGVITMTPPTS